MAPEAHRLGSVSQTRSLEAATSASPNSSNRFHPYHTASRPQSTRATSVVGTSTTSSSPVTISRSTKWMLDDQHLTFVNDEGEMGRIPTQMLRNLLFNDNVFSFLVTFNQPPSGSPPAVQIPPSVPTSFDYGTLTHQIQNMVDEKNVQHRLTDQFVGSSVDISSSNPFSALFESQTPKPQMEPGTNIIVKRSPTQDDLPPNDPIPSIDQGMFPLVFGEPDMDLGLNIDCGPLKSIKVSPKGGLLSIFRLVHDLVCYWDHQNRKVEGTAKSTEEMFLDPRTNEPKKKYLILVFDKETYVEVRVGGKVVYPWDHDGQEWFKGQLLQIGNCQNPRFKFFDPAFTTDNVNNPPSLTGDPFTRPRNCRQHLASGRCPSHHSHESLVTLCRLQLDAAHAADHDTTSVELRPIRSHHRARRVQQPPALLAQVGASSSTWCG